MIWEFLFWSAIVLSLAIGLVYFRDLGDVSQMVLKVKRENMLRFIRHEYQFLGVGLAAALVATVSHLAFGAGVDWALWISLLLVAFLYGFPWVRVHIGLRNQSDSAEFFNDTDINRIDEAA